MKAEQLHAVLDRLVDTQVIDSRQRSILLKELEEFAQLPGTIPSQRHVNVRDRLIEAGLYVGAALITVAGFVLVAQRWNNFSHTVQVVLLVCVALVAAGLAALVLSTESRSEGAPAHSPARRRLFGTLCAISAFASGGAVTLIVDNAHWNIVAAMAAALCVFVVAQTRAPSAITEIGMFGAGCGLLIGTQELWSRAYDDESRISEQLVALLLVAYAMSWAMIVARRLTLPVLAVALGSVVTLQSSAQLIFEDQSRTLGLMLAAAITVLAFWQFVTRQVWPWLALALAELTVFMFELVGGSQRPALAFLIAGLVLLGGSTFGLKLRHKNPAK